MVLEESLTLSTKIGTGFVRHQQKAFLAACLLALGQSDGVPPLCEEAIGLAEEAGDKWIKALGLRTLAEASSTVDPSDPQKAETAILQAIRLLEEIGAKPELARSYVSYARLLNAKGETAKAKGHLATAIGMFREMGMAWDLERAEQTLREL